MSSGRALRLAEGLDLATRRVDCVVVIGSTCVGKTTLVDAVRRSAVAQQGRVVVPTRFVTRPSRVNDDMTENVHLTREQFEQRAATGGIGLRWVRRMEDGRRVDYGFERPPARALPVYSGNNALCANPGGVRPPDALAHALLVGVYAPDAERERRLRARSPDLWSGRPAEARYRLAEPADAIRAHAHVVIENHGDLAAEAPAELVRLVTSLADRLAGPST